MDENSKKKLMLLCRILFLIYMCVLIYVVFLSDGYHRVEGYTEFRYNLVPGVEIHRFFVYWNEVGLLKSLENLLGNVLAFAPFGALLRFVVNKKVKCFEVVGATFLLSLMIETVQLITRVGVFDVDDLMLNTLGGLIGFVIYFVLAKLDKKRGKNEKQE